MNPLLSRRGFFYVGSAVAGLSAAGYFVSLFTCRGAPRPLATLSSSDVETKIFTLIDDGARALELGSAFSLQVKSVTQPILGLAESSELTRIASAISCGESARLMLYALFSEDFRCGRTQIVDGWVLSESEARICARWAAYSRSMSVM